MAFGLLNWFMLFGLVAVAIPVIIHLLNRRRFDIVDWGAMQFLQVSEVTRRKIFIEELLLMLLRMGLIALLVLAMAAPWAAGRVLEWVGLAENRDLVLVFDGSNAMSYTDDSDKSAQQKAVAWSQKLLKELAAGDNVAILQGREQVVPVLPQLTSDRRQVEKALEQLAAPQGSCDWPQAVEAARQLLQTSRRARREIILLSDGRKAGWADERTVRRWDLLAPQLAEGDAPPRLWAATFAHEQTEPIPNWSLTPLRSERAQAWPSMVFRGTIKIQGQKYEQPYSLRYRADHPEEPKADETVKGGNLTLQAIVPTDSPQKDLRLPLTFAHTFDGPGSHLLSLIVEPDSPERKADKSQVGRPLKDRLAGDNRQDFAVMLPLLPVLLVDDLPPHPGQYRGADILQVALAPTIDKSRLVRAKVVPLDEMITALSLDVGPEPSTKPRVLILCDVPQLSAEQQVAVGAFVENGGGLLITHGPRSKAEHYNKDLYRDGLGLLPAALQEQAGNEEDLDTAAHPQMDSFNHPALEIFRPKTAREKLSGGLGNARFPRWWKLARPEAGAPAVAVAELTTGQPFLVEKRYGKGRVLQCAVPLDSSWNTNVHKLEVLEFTPMAFEMVAYLAGSRGIDYNLTPGQPLVYVPQDDESKESATLKPPKGDAVELEGNGGSFVHKDTRMPGIYTLTTSRNRTVYYVVQSDARGSDDLLPCTDEERTKVGEMVKLTYTTEASQILAGDKRDVWWLVFLGVIGFLCCEVWLTRRIVKGR